MLPTTAWRWFGLSVAVLVVAGAAVTQADPDLWGHVRFGLDTIRSGHLTSVDPYSFTQDQPWINHEWLSEAQMGLAYAAAGPAGLSLLKAALAAGSLFLAWAALASVRISVRIIVCVLLVMGTLHMWATMRPQLWTLLCFTILCRLLVEDRRARLWWLPAIFAFWVNCHGGWIVGLGVLGVWAAGSVVLEPRTLPRWTVVVGSSVIATLVNPYGWHLWAFMWRTVHMNRSIQEWGPLWGTPGLNWVPWFAACGAAAWSLWPLRIANVRKSLRAVAVLAMLGFSSARVMRIESLYILTAAILLEPWLAATWPRRARQTTVVPASAEKAAAIVGTMVALGAAVFLGIRALSCIRVLGPWSPDGATALVLNTVGTGRLVTYFDWGEYAIWHFGPRLKVSMDGRRETVYSDARLSEHDAILAGTPAGLAALAAWRAEYVWLPATSVVTKRWLLANGYRIDADGARSFVGVRADLPRLAAQVSTVPADCFPQ